MAERVVLSFPGRDAGCEIEPVEGGVELSLRFDDQVVRGVIDLESAWRLCDELSRVVSLAATGAALERARAAEEVAKRLEVEGGGG
jgi:hypothetical protein